MSIAVMCRESESVVRMTMGRLALLGDPGHHDAGHVGGPLAVRLTKRKYSNKYGFTLVVSGWLRR